MACVSLTSRNVRLRTTLTFGARWHPLATADVQLEMLPGLRARRHHLNTQHGFLCMCAKCEADSKEKEESAEPTETQGKRAAAAVATAVATANEDIAMHQAGEPEFMNVAELLAAQSTSVGGGTQDTLAAFDARLVDRFVSAQVMEQRGQAELAAATYSALLDDYFASRSGESPGESLGESPESPAATEGFDESGCADLGTPPAPLVASVALNSLGGFLLDEGHLERARSCFVRSLELWPRHGMALVNLADLERENGSRDAAVEHYTTAAALPPLLADDEEDEEDDDGEEEEDDAEHDAASGRGDERGWFTSWVAAPRAEAVSLASYMLALHLHQSLCFEGARRLLRRFRGVKFRVAPSIWRAVAEPTAPPRSLLTSSQARDCGLVRRFDGALPKPLLRALQTAFAPGASFWQETDYKERGYFSFWHDLRTQKQQPAHLVELLARHLLPITGGEDRIVGAEWWVHTRSERRSIGHQMHFDTEECTLAQGRVLHPLVSTVVYLSGMPAPDANGSLGSTAAARGSTDPTVVFDMRVEDDGAETAAVSHPAQGSVLFFPGDRLHCVCPAGVSSATRKRGNGGDGRGSAEKLTPSENLPQRLTLMIGFWAEDVASEGKRRPLGACGPIPRATRACSWPSSLAIPAALRTTDLPAATSIAVPRAVPVVEAPWQNLEEQEDLDLESEVEEERNGRVHEAPLHDAKEAEMDAANAAWEGRLEVPEARNHRFFVGGLCEFREQLC